MKIAENRQFHGASPVAPPKDVDTTFLGRGRLAKLRQLAWPWRVVLGSAAAGLGLALRWAFSGIFEFDHVSFLTFYPGAALAAMLGGWVCGGAAAIVSAFLVFIAIGFPWHGQGPLLLGAFLFNGVIVSLSGELLHRSWAALGDVERHRRETDLLRLANERLKLANTVAAIGTFDADLRSQSLFHDEAVSEMFGIPRGASINRTTMSSLASEEAHSLLMEAVEQAMAPNGDGRFRSEIKIRRKNDGVARVIAAQGQVYFDDGVAVRMIGVCRDVTEERSAEREALQRATLAEQLAAVASAAPGVIYSIHLGADGWVSAPFAAPRAREVLGLEPVEAVVDASAFLRLIHPADFPAVESGMLASARQLRRWSGVFRYLHPDRGQIWIESHAMATAEPNGGVIWHGYLHDVTERVRGEQALRESEQRNAAFFKNANVGAAEIDPDLRFLRVNARYCQIVGYSEAQLLTMRATDLSLPEMRAADEDGLSRHLSGEIPRYLIENPFMRMDGTVIWAQVAGSLVQDASGRPLYSVTLLTDVTEQKLAATALEKSRSQLLAIVEQAPVSIAMFDRKMNYLAASRRYAEEFGRGVQALATLNHYDLNPDLPSKWKTLHERTLEGEYFSADEEYWKDSSGHEHWFRWTLSPWTDESGDIGGLILLIQDMGQQRRAESAIRESEERLRQIGDNLPDSVVYRFVRGDNGRAQFLHMSAGVEGLIGASPDNILRDGELFFSRFSPESLALMRAAELESLTELSDFRVEGRFLRVDGETGWAIIRSRPRKLADGAIVFDGVCTDITRQKAVEAALEESEDKFRNAFAAASVGFVMSMRSGAIVDANAAFCELTGYHGDELRGMSLFDLVHPDDRAAKARIAKGASGAEPPAYVTETRYRRKDGEIIWVRQSASLTRDKSGQPKWLIHLVEDVTQRKRSEAMVTRTLRHLRAVLNGAKDAIVAFDEHGAVQSINMAGVAMFGFAEEEIVGQPAAVLFPSPSAAPSVNGFDSASVGRSAVGAVEVDALRKDGSTFPIEISVVRTEADNSPISVAFIRELSERRRIESRIEKLTTQRLSAMGGMAAALAHELNQPLATVGIYLETARHRLRHFDDERLDSARGALERAMEQVMRAGYVVSHLREFIAHGEPDKTHQSLHNLAREISQSATPRTGSAIEVQLELRAESDEVLMDKVQIGQVLSNLLRNAREALDGAAGGRIRITTRLEGDAVRLTVADNGPGIHPDIRDRLFEPLVTSKPGGKGIGLSICKSIVEAHYGNIIASDVEGGGAAFSFTLPLVVAESLE